MILLEGRLPRMKRRTRARSTLRTAAGPAAASAVLLALAGCGGGGGGGGPTSATPSAAPTTTSATPTVTGTAPADPAKARAEVTANWEQFFSPDTPLSQKAALLQNGDRLSSLLQSFSNDPRVGQVAAKVRTVTFTSPMDATVAYSLSLKGSTIAPDASGVSVLQNGVWKVSLKTLCGLISQDSGASRVPGC